LRAAPDSGEAAHVWAVGGQVQGVGFRPFVYRLAQRFRLNGWVRNRSGHVDIFTQGNAQALVAFGEALFTEAPPLAQPQLLASDPAPCRPLAGFTILASEEGGKTAARLPPDMPVCDDCLRELHDPAGRRYRYPFINCTQCGPRYTIIARLPYDRPHTTLAGFPLCADCRREYEDPRDRRFHAQPLACPRCGPQLTFSVPGEPPLAETATALAAVVAALRAGVVVAVKGVGGYHLLCDAQQTAAVERLRQTKPRPHKPLAVMYPPDAGLARLRRDVWLTGEEEARLRDSARPIVLAAKRPAAALSPAIAPGVNDIGVLLPYSPLHHLLLEDFGGPLVATSGNIGGEPVLTANGDAERRLGRVAGAFLHHNRPIQRPADDSVYRVIAGAARPLRLGRGVAPLELTLPFERARPLLAVGGHLKNTLALAWGRRVVISPHIGDLDTVRGRETFVQTAADLQALYGVRAEAVACDAHPGYAATRWAKDSGLPMVSVWHHFAHASALAGEYPEIGEWLVFTWDGAGYGADGALWGGEALLGAPRRWRRAATFRPFFLPGGERAAREPWRSGAALAWEAGLTWDGLPEGGALLHDAWRRRVNCSRTSAVGRLFDAAAALAGLLREASFEGQGGMWLEAACGSEAAPIALPLGKNGAGAWQSDWSPLLPLLLDSGRAVGEKAAIFHASLAYALLAQARAARREHPIDAVGLSGGVFQNRRLTEQAAGLLAADGFSVRLARRLPCNDGGLCFGQLIEAGNG